MITLQELNPKSFPVTEEIKKNLDILLKRINIVRTKYGKPMIVTSGLRSKEDHKRIYIEKGIPESKIPWGSRHLTGEAADISDPKGELWRWCLANEDVLEEAGLWVEDDPKTPRVHIQIVAPKSGKRFFKP